MVVLTEPINEAVLRRLAEKSETSVRERNAAYIRWLLGIDKILRFKKSLGPALGPVSDSFLLSRITQETVWISAVREPKTAELLSAVLGIDIEVNEWRPVVLTEETTLAFLKPDQRVTDLGSAIFYTVYAFDIIPELEKYCRDILFPKVEL